MLGSQSTLSIAVWSQVQEAIEQLNSVTKECLEYKGVSLRQLPGVDHFIVGYCVGGALKAAELNGLRSSEIDTGTLLSHVQRELEKHISDLSVPNVYRSGSNALSCGILLGHKEPTVSGTKESLRVLCQYLVHGGVGPELYMTEWASSNLSIGYDHQVLIQSAMREMMAK